MSALQLSITRGDSATLVVPLRDASGLRFDPSAQVLLFTAKRALTDTDAQAVFQHSSASGAITTRFRNGQYEALVACVPSDTTGITAAANLYIDLQAQANVGGAITTAAQGRLQVSIDVTVNTTTSVTEYTSQPPLPASGAVAKGLTNITNDAANVVVVFSANLSNAAYAVSSAVRKPNTAAEHLFGSVLDDSVTNAGFTFEFVTNAPASGYKLDWQISYL